MWKILPLAVVGCATQALASEAVRPNVLLIIADDLATRVGCYGDTTARTPALDRLAQSGVCFDRAYAASTVCTPSRKSLLTGLSITKVGADNSVYLQAHPDAMTMPRWFREHGYQTAQVGKVEHTIEYAGPKDWEVVLPTHAPKGVVHTYRGTDGATISSRVITPDGVTTRDQESTARCIAFLQGERDTTRPFFFALGLHTPHVPVEYQAAHGASFALDRMPMTQAPRDATPITKPPSYSKRLIEELMTPKPGAALSTWGVDDPATYNATVPEAMQREVIRDYYAAISMMDVEIGRVMACLDAQGLTQSTIVVVTSDQGYFLGYRGMWSKHYLYPEVLRVPLIVRAPGMTTPGTRAGGIVELLDLFPTLADAAGLPTPGNVDGKSFVPALRDPTHAGKPAAYAKGIMYGGRAVITRQGWYLDWPAGPLWVRGAAGTASGASLAQLDGLIDLQRLRRPLTVHLDGPQRWIDIAGQAEASREFYRVDRDPQAWHNVLQAPAEQEAVAQHERLMRAYFPAVDGTNVPAAW